MARHRADQPEDDAAKDSRVDNQASDPDEETVDEQTVADDSGGRSSKADAFWEQVNVEPVEIALPRGVGYTLRAYRMSDTLQTEESEESVDDLADDETDEGEAPEPAPPRTRKTVAASRPSSRRPVATKVDEDEEEDEDEPGGDELDEGELDDGDREDDNEDEDDEENEENLEPEEVPVFLTQDRRLLLFRSPEGLVKYVRSGEPNSMRELAEWDELSGAITAEHVVAGEDDRYELDLVVENLRGGQDAWDAELLIKAGELSRDLGYALRLESVISALSPGSPLDDLDEALRSVAAGGIGGFFARRKLRRIGAQQAALAWRSIIGKISTSVDWRD